MSAAVEIELPQEPRAPSTGVLRCWCTCWRWEQRLADYDRNVKRYDSEPETGEGKKELMTRARMLFGGALILGILGSLATFNGFLLLI
jgi:hypothetical protein